MDTWCCGISSVEVVSIFQIVWLDQDQHDACGVNKSEFTSLGGLAACSLALPHIVTFWQTWLWINSPWYHWLEVYATSYSQDVCPCVITESQDSFRIQRNRQYKDPPIFPSCTRYPAIKHSFPFLRNLTLAGKKNVRPGRCKINLFRVAASVWY